MVGRNNESRRAHRRTNADVVREVLTEQPNGFSNHFANVQYVASGSFGLVFRAIYRGTNLPVAAKFLIPVPEWLHNGVARDFYNEFNIIKELQGERHIVKLEEPGLFHLKQVDGKSWYLPKALPPEVSTSWIGFTMHLYTGDVSDLVKKYGASLKLLKAVLPQCVAGLQEMHRRGYVHHDVKPANFLYGQGVVVVSDFGVATKVKRSIKPDGEMCGLMGTEYYMSYSEAIHQAANGVGCDDPYADIESLANAMYTVFVGTLPWDKVSFGDSIPMRHAFYQQRPSSSQTVPSSIIKRLGYFARQRRVGRVPLSTLQDAETSLAEITGEALLE